MTALTAQLGPARDARLSADDDVAVARRVLAIEAEALAMLAQGLGAAFGDAVAILLKVEGRVVVSGMGKSGHVARKIAATLASTGTPAHFVHPAEASHGDLGMISRQDALIVLSNSGDTPELSDLIAHAKRQAIPLLGIAARAESSLMRAADIALVLPPAKEACAIGMAPTTSTTMMMALGDALAVALMERRGFSRDDYKALHPGGQLGKKLLAVSDLMRTAPDLPLTGPETPLADLLLIMSEGGLGCAGIVDDQGRVIGAVSDGDIRRFFANRRGADAFAAVARAVMVANPKAIASHALAVEAVQVMSETGRGISWLFVVDPGIDPQAGPYPPRGIIHLKDCLKAGIA